MTFLRNRHNAFTCTCKGVLLFYSIIESVDIFRLVNMSTKRPRTELSLCKKYDIVKELNGGAKQADVAKKYGINESTVSRIKKERQSISKKFETGEKNPKQKRNRNIGFADVDQALYNWVVSTASGLPGLSGQMLCQWAHGKRAEIFRRKTFKRANFRFGWSICGRRKTATSHHWQVSAATLFPKKLPSYPIFRQQKSMDDGFYIC